MERATYTVREAAMLLGVGRDAAYNEIKRSGKLAGVEAIHVSRHIRIPAARLNAALGIETADDESQAA